MMRAISWVLCVPLRCRSFRSVKEFKGRQGYRFRGLLGGSWDLVSGVISKVTTVIITYNPN